MKTCTNCRGAGATFLTWAHSLPLSKRFINCSICNGFGVTPFPKGPDRITMHNKPTPDWLSKVTSKTNFIGFSKEVK